MSTDVLWSGWQGPARVVAMAVLSYVFLIILLRTTGKRTLSKMNAFDFVITIASGSAFASVLLDKNVSFVEGAIAFTMLAVMQLLVTFASTRSSFFEGLVKSDPTLLLWRGRLRREAMDLARVTENEILAVCRNHGIHSLEEVEAIVLETAGEMSLLRRRRDDAPIPEHADTLRVVEGTRDRQPAGSSSVVAQSPATRGA